VQSAIEDAESTDELMYPSCVELTETSEQFLSPGETRPLVITALDTAEDSSDFAPNNSEAATTVVPVEHAKTRAVVYSNSGPGDPIIIITGDEGEKYPVSVPNTAGEPGCLERDAQDATVATVVAGAEQKIRSGRWY